MLGRRNTRLAVRHEFKHSDNILVFVPATVWLHINTSWYQLRDYPANMFVSHVHTIPPIQRSNGATVLLTRTQRHVWVNSIPFKSQITMMNIYPYNYYIDNSIFSHWNQHMKLVWLRQKRPRFWCYSGSAHHLYNKLMMTIVYHAI